MTKPESRRFKPVGGLPSRSTPGPQPRLPMPAAPPPNGSTPTKTTRHVPRTRRIPTAEGQDGEMMQAPPLPKKQNPMILIGSVSGGIFLLIIIIAAAASSGSSGYSSSTPRRPEKKAAPPPPPPPPSESRSYNYVVNTGSIVFVCAGTDVHPDKEVIVSTCQKCSGVNKFAWDDTARAYRCSGCSAVYENASIRCPECNRPPRVTKLKKVIQRQQK